MLSALPTSGRGACRRRRVEGLTGAIRRPLVASRGLGERSPVHFLGCPYPGHHLKLPPSHQIPVLNQRKFCAPIHDETLVTTWVIRTTGPGALSGWGISGSMATGGSQNSTLGRHSCWTWPTAVIKPPQIKQTFPILFLTLIYNPRLLCPNRQRLGV